MTNIEFTHKVSHIAHSGSAKRIDTLIIIAHCKDRTVVATEHFDPRILKPIGVLELIDQQMLKAPLIMLFKCRVVSQQLIRTKHQFSKIHNPFSIALLFIEVVQLDPLFGVRVIHRQVLGPFGLLFCCSDEPLQLFGREPFFIHTELLAKSFDR